MNFRSKDFVEYLGLEAPKKAVIKNFSECHLVNTFKLPKDKSLIDSLTTISLSTSIKNIKVIDTINGFCSGGKYLNGKNLIIHSILEESVQYVDKTLLSSINNATFKIPFSTFIQLPQNFNKDFPLNEINFFIQHINSKIKDSYFIYQSINLVAYY